MSAWPSGILKSGIDGNRPFLALQPNRFDEQARVLVEDRRRQQAFAVPRGGRHDHLHARDVHEPRLQALRMRCAGGQSRIDLGADGDRRRGAPGGHESQFGGVVDQLVGGDTDEVHDHDLGHRQHPVDGRADRGADDRGFRDRGVQDPVVAVLRRQPRRRPGRPRVGDVLTEQEHSVVGLQRLIQREVQRLAHRHLFVFHAFTPGT